MFRSLDLRPNRRWLLVVALVALGAICARAEEGGDFRNASWGDSIDRAMRSETATFHHRSDDELAFTDDSLEGIDGGILYLFDRGRLVTGLYVSREGYPGGVGALEDYATLRRDLERRLGGASDESRRWVGDEGAVDPDELAGERLAAAVADGRLRVSTEWTLERTHVELIMTGTEDGGVFVRAVYRPTG